MTLNTCRVPTKIHIIEEQHDAYKYKRVNLAEKTGAHTGAPLQKSCKTSALVLMLQMLQLLLQLWQKLQYFR